MIKILECYKLYHNLNISISPEIKVITNPCLNLHEEQLKNFISLSVRQGVQGVNNLNTVAVFDSLLTTHS